MRKQGTKIDLEQLFERAYQSASTDMGSLTNQELAAVADVLRSDGAAIPEKRMAMRILGYAGATIYKELVGGFLGGPSDVLAWTALWVLCHYWTFTDQYATQLAEFIRGTSWDRDGICQVAALNIASEHLGKHAEPRLLQAIIDSCADDSEGNGVREQACQTLSEHLMLHGHIEDGSLPISELLEIAREI